MSKLLSAIRAKYRTPADAVRALGLDPKLLEEEPDVRNNPLPYKPYRLRLAGDAEPSLTAEKCIETLRLLIPELDEVEADELLEGLKDICASGDLHQWVNYGEDRRHRGSYDRRRLGGDNPPRFEGEPEVGGGELGRLLREDAEDRARERRRTVLDARRRVAADAMPAGAASGFFKRYPGASNIGNM